LPSITGGINLEDIKAPECFEVEERCRARMKIPVFHDDQHELVDVVLGQLDVEHVDAGELLEQDGLALHHRLRGEACEAIAADPDEAATLTARQNLVAVVSNGTAVLGPSGLVGWISSFPGRGLR
jgi:malic enzyme